MTFGRGDQESFKGWMDEIRISKGIARYKENFDTSDILAPFQPDQYTKLLYHFSPDSEKIKDPAGLTPGVLTGPEIFKPELGSPQIDHTATPHGGIQIVSDGKIGSAASFDGVDDYLQVPNSEDLDFGSKDFTVDFWMKPKSPMRDDGYVWSLYQGGSSGDLPAFQVNLTTESKMRVYIVHSGGGSWVEFKSDKLIPLDQWSHIALVRKDNRLMLFVNGVLYIDANVPSNDQNIPTTGKSLDLDIGMSQSGSGPIRFFHGELDEYRVTKGTARWTSDFNNDLKDLDTFYQSGVKSNLFLHFDSVTGTGFESQELWTQIGAKPVTVIGDTKLAEDKDALDGYAASFDGSGDYLSIPDSPDLDFGTEDFTVDLRFKVDVPRDAHLAVWDFATGNYYNGIQVRSDGSIYAFFGPGADGTYSEIVLAAKIQVKTWYHMAVVRKDNSIQIYLDGKLIGSMPKTNAVANTSSTLRIGIFGYGGIYSGDFKGWMDEFRISKIARWTSNFEVPTKAYDVDLDTALLLHFNPTVGMQDVPKINLNRQKILDDAKELVSILFPRTPQDALKIPGAFYTEFETYGKIALDTFFKDTSRGTMNEIFGGYTPFQNADEVGRTEIGNLLKSAKDSERYLDMNGDGILDRVTVDGNNAWWVEYGNSRDGYDAVKQIKGTDLMGVSPKLGSVEAKANSKDDYLVTDFADMNGDGLPDRVIRMSKDEQSAGTNYQYEYWAVQLNIWDPVNRETTFSEVDQWGNVDSSYSSDAKASGSLAWRQEDSASSAISYRSILIDLNGDKKADRLFYCDQAIANTAHPMVGWYVQWNNGKGFDTAQLWDSKVRSMPSWSHWGKDSMRVIKDPNGDRRLLVDLRDVTGDGLADRISVEQDAASVINTRWYVEVNTGVACGGADGGVACGFQEAVEWRGIQGSNNLESSLGQDVMSYTDRPVSLTAPKVGLVDVNGDKIADRLYSSGGQWKVQYGTGKGFLPAADLNIQGQSFDLDAKNTFNASRYDYMYVSLKADEAIGSTQGVVRVELTAPVQMSMDEFKKQNKCDSLKGCSEEVLKKILTQDNEKGLVTVNKVVKFWTLSDLTKDWKDYYLKLDSSAAGATAMSACFVNSSDTSCADAKSQKSGVGAPKIYVNSMTFTDLRPNEAKAWLDYFLTDQSVISDMNSSQNQVLADILKNGQLSASLGIDWQKVLNADIEMTETTQESADKKTVTTVTDIVRFDGTKSRQEKKTSQADDGTKEDENVSTSTFENGTTVEVKSDPADPNKETRIVTTPADPKTGAAAKTETTSIEYGRVRSVEKACEIVTETCKTKKITYEYETVNGVEVTTVKDPELKIVEKHASGKLIEKTESDGLIKKFSYSASGVLEKIEVYYADQLRQTIQYQTLSNGHGVSISEDGSKEEFDENGDLVARTTAAGYRYVLEKTDALTTQIGEPKKYKIYEYKEGAEGEKEINGEFAELEVPTIDFVKDPSQKIQQLRLHDYASADGDYVEYGKEEVLETQKDGTVKILEAADYSVVKQVTLKDGTIIRFDRIVTEDVWDNVALTSTRKRTVMDVTVIDPNGTETVFKDGKPYSVKNPKSAVLDLREENGAPVSDQGAAQFHIAEARKLWDSVVVKVVEKYTLADSVIVNQQYSLKAGEEQKDGVSVLDKQLTREYADGSMEIYDDQGRVAMILSHDGERMVTYEYDTDGVTKQIVMEGSRRRLDMSVNRLMYEITNARVDAIIEAAERGQIYKQLVDFQIGEVRKQLQEILAQIQAAKAELAAMSVKGKKASQAKSDGMAQIEGAENQVYSQMASLPQKKQELFNKIAEQEKQAVDQIELESKKSMDQVKREKEKMLQTIVTQETLPIVLQLYRKLLGRDPSQAEVDAVIGTVASMAAADEEAYQKAQKGGICDPENSTIAYDTFLKDCGPGTVNEKPRTKYFHFEQVAWGTDQKLNREVFDMVLLRTELATSDERFLRGKEVAGIIKDVRGMLECYVHPESMSCSTVSTILEDLELTSEQVVSLTDDDMTGILARMGNDKEVSNLSDKTKICNWLDKNNINLHFGQSAYSALDEILVQNGIAAEKRELATRMIMIDILTGTLTRFDQGDLKLSIYAMEKTAQYYLKQQKPGVEVQSYAMNYETLRAMFERQCTSEAFTDSGKRGSCGFKSVVVINSVHYVIVTGFERRQRKDENGKAVLDSGGKEIWDEYVIFTDPGMGAYGKHQETVVSAEEFMEIWGSAQGKVSEGSTGQASAGWGYVISARAPPEIVKDGYRILDTKEKMSVRAAFWGWILLIFKRVREFVDKVIEKVLSLVKKVLVILLTVINITTPGFSYLVKIGSWIQDKIGGWLGKTFGKVPGISDLLGWQKQIWNTFREANDKSLQIISESRFLRTVRACVQVVAGVVLVVVGTITAQPEIIGLGVSMVGQGVGDLLAIHTDLSPKTIEMIKLGAEVLAVAIGGFANGGNIGGAMNALKQAAPILAGEFAAYGVSALGDHLGWDPRLTSLISIPVRMAVGGAVSHFTADKTFTVIDPKTGDTLTLTDTRSFLEHVSDAVFSGTTMAGVVSVGADYVLDKAGAPDWTRDLTQGFISGFASSETGKKFFNWLGQGAQNFAGWVWDKGVQVVEFGKNLIGTAVDKGAELFRSAIHEFASVFSQQTRDELYKEYAGALKGTVTVEGDVWTWQGENTTITFNTKTGEATNTAGGTTMDIDGLGRGSNGEYGYKELTYKNVTEDGMYERTYQNGKLVGYEYCTNSGVCVTANADPSTPGGILSDGTVIEGQVSVYIPGPDESNPPEQQDPTNPPNWHDSTTIDFNVHNGQASDVHVETPSEPGVDIPSTTTPPSLEDIIDSAMGRIYIEKEDPFLVVMQTLGEIPDPTTIEGTELKTLVLSKIPAEERIKIPADKLALFDNIASVTKDGDKITIKIKKPFDYAATGPDGKKTKLKVDSDLIFKVTKTENPTTVNLDFIGVLKPNPNKPGEIIPGSNEPLKVQAFFTWQAIKGFRIQQGVDGYTYIFAKLFREFLLNPKKKEDGNG